MQSCDICRKRKVKCDRRTPCARCRRLRQPCTYTDILRKKGPKFVHSYPRIYSTSLTASGSGSESVSAPSLMGPLTASVCGSSETLPLPSSMNRNVGIDLGVEGPIHIHSSSGIQSGVDSGAGTASEPDEELNLDLDFDFEDVPSGQQLRTPQNSGLGRAFGPDVPLDSLSRTAGLETSLEGMLSVYVEKLHPLFPVADLREIQDTLRTGGCGQNSNYEKYYGFDPTQYALLCSLCAVTYAQLTFSSGRGLSSFPATMDQIQGHEHACLKYLQAALEAQRLSDHPQVNLTSRQGQATGGSDRSKARDKILTSFYLFMTYWSLKRVRHAWWYLRECIALLLSVRMHQEEEHRKLDMREAETRRVLFWGVFVAERVPSPLDEEENVTTIPGFVRLVTLFRGLDVDLSGCWTAAGFVTPISLSLSRGTAVATTTTDASRTAAGPHGHEYDDTVPEREAGIPFQQLDLAITREWLRAKMWKLGIPGHQQSSSPREFVAALGKEGDRWRLKEPLLIGKATLGILQSMEEILQDNWSAIMDEKLYDICECLCDIRPVMQTRGNGVRDVEVEIDLDQILRGLLDCLARLRGRSAYLLASFLGD
ncbi:Zn(II)2Cys6 transcription factor [Aspergillus foveolatus]|uniref:Zn(II)2Cys6 transcription factor n=1 Tax=Aspergillus foveolatus TaxID=210207 RepID=UPI003CCD0975